MLLAIDIHAKRGFAATFLASALCPIVTHPLRPDREHVEMCRIAARGRARARSIRFGKGGLAHARQNPIHAVIREITLPNDVEQHVRVQTPDWIPIAERDLWKCQPTCGKQCAPKALISLAKRGIGRPNWRAIMRSPGPTASIFAEWHDRQPRRWQRALADFTQQSATGSD
jgi:hypothetical protein